MGDKNSVFLDQLLFDLFLQLGNFLRINLGLKLNPVKVILNHRSLTYIFSQLQSIAHISLFSIKFEYRITNLDYYPRVESQ